MHELNPEQFQKLVRYYLKYMNKLISYHQLKSACAYIVLNMEMGLKKPLTTAQRETMAENIFMIGEACDSFFDLKQEEETIIFQLKHNFVNNLIPQFKHKRTVYYGPKDALENATWGEYLSAYLNFQLYVTTQENKYLLRLIASLYRPSRRFHWLKSFRRNDDHVKQIPFAESLVERYAQELEGLDPAIAHGIFLWFRGCQEFIATGTIELEGNEIDLSILFGGEESKEPKGKAGLGLTGITYTLAEEGTFGTVDEVQKQNLYTVLLKLYQIVSSKPTKKPPHDSNS